jgi:hypothetical protein
MHPPAGQLLDYARAPARGVLRVPWLGLAAAVFLTAACAVTSLYENLEEPFLAPAGWRDVAMLRVLPVLLVAAWLGWIVLICWRTPPRILALGLLVVGSPLSIWSSRLTLGAHNRFESDQAQVADWYRMATEEAASRPKE